MTNKKQKYILSSAAVLAVGFASALGTMNIVSNLTPRSLALEDLPHCTNVQQSQRWGGETLTVSSPINITEDIIASYTIPDQTERCKVEINLNGHTVSEAYYGRYGVTESLVAGKNAVVVVNGDGGKFAIGTPQAPPPECTTYYFDDGTSTEMCSQISEFENVGGSLPSGVFVGDGGELYLNDITVEGQGDAVYIYKGTVVANNVTATSSMWNNGGNLTVDGGDYYTISAKNNANTTINDGTFRSVRVESGSNVTLNGGTIQKWTGEPGGEITSVQELAEDNRVLPSFCVPSATNDITINGGDYENLTVNTPVTITGGNFTNSTFSSVNEITSYDGGSYDGDPAPSVVSGGNFNNASFNDNTEISNGTFKNTEFNGETTVSNGSFENTSFTNDDSSISGGTFRASNISSSADISGGSFDNIPAATNITDDKKVIENEDGSYSVVDEDAPGEEPIPQCEIRIYTDENTFTTYTGSITLTEDTVASYEVDDQSGICRFTINLNGNKLTSVDNKEAISIGSNVSAKINGENGTIEQANTDDPSSSEPAPAAIVIKGEGAASIKDVTIETNSEENPGISNSGKATLSNVSAGEGTNIENNDGGELVVNSGEYSNITTTDSGSVTVNGGKVDEVVTNNNSEVTINDGDFTDSTITSSNNDQTGGESTPSTNPGSVTVNGGNFGNSTIDVPSNITGGDFDNANINGQSDISGGSFENSNINGQSDISGGSFDNTNVNGQSEISGGSFENSNINGQTTITDGTFTGTTVLDDTEISGGSFDTRPSEDNLPEGTEIIEHDDGTFEIRNTATNRESDNTKTTTPAEDVPEEEAIKIPNTGGFLASETEGKQFFIGAILAVEGTILAICGYVLHRLYKNYRVDFHRK